MNLHGYLMRENILYTSDEAIDFSNVFFIIRYYSIKASMELAIDKNVKFKGFEKSEYAKGNKSKVLSKYYNESFLPKQKKYLNYLKVYIFQLIRIGPTF